jgi:PAS domain S-box-containing protein
MSVKTQNAMAENPGPPKHALADEWIQAEQSRLLWRILPWLGRALAVGTIAALVGTARNPTVWQLWTMLAILAGNIGAYMLAAYWSRRGRLAAGSYLITTALAIASLAMAILFEQLIVAFAIVVLLIGLLAGVLISSRAGYGFVLVLAVLGLVLYALNVAGVFDPTFNLGDRKTELVDTVVFFFTVFMGMHFTSLNQEGTRRALGQLIQQSNDLRTINARLEQEIAERQRAEEALATTQALLMAAIEQTPAGVIVADAPDVKIRLANAAALGIRGEMPEPLTDIPVSLHPSRWQTFYPDGTPHAAEDLPLSRAILAGETSRGVEVIIRRESGEDRWVWANAAPVRDAGGGIIAGVVVFLDITERKQVENEVRRLKDFNESIVQNMAEGITVEDAAGYFTFVNPAAASILGYAPEALLGQHWTSIVPSDQQSIVRAADERRERGEADRYELELLRQDGTRFSILVSGGPLPNKAGRFAGSLAVFTDITERVRAEDELQQAKEQLEKQNSRLRTLYRVGQTVNSTLETDAILAQLTDEAMRVTRAKHGQVLVVREESGYFERRSQRGFSPEEIKRAHSDLLPLDQGVNGRAYLSHQIVRVDDVQAEPDYFPLIPTTRTELAVPIIRGGEVLGNLDLQSPTPGAFCDVDLDYLNALTDQVAIAIENARLFEDEQRAKRELAAKVDELSVLNKTIQTMMRTTNLTGALDVAANTIVRLLNARNCGITLLNEAKTELNVIVSASLDSDYPSTVGIKIPVIDNPSSKQVIETQRSLVVTQPQTHLLTTLIHPLLQELNTQCLMIVPLLARAEVIGTIGVDTDQPNREFIPAEVQLVETIAGQIASIIGIAHLIEKEQHQRQVAESLQQIAIVLNSSLDLEAVIAKILEQIKYVIKCDGAGLFLQDGEDLVLSGGFGFDETLKGYKIPLNSKIQSAQVFHSHEPRIVADVGTDPHWDKSVADERIKGWMAAPLLSGERAIGVLTADNFKVRAYSQEDARILLTFASQAALAIENARLYEQAQQEIADRKRAEAKLHTYAAKLERSNYELEAFAYVASHDLQEPLRKVKAFGDRLKVRYAAALDERGLDYLNRMQGAAERMQDLIDALLIYSRVTTQTQPFVPVDLAQVAREVVSDLEVRIEHASGQVQVGELPSIDADPTQIRQLLQNLIGNALKFHRPSVPPVVQIQAQLLDAQERHRANGVSCAQWCEITIQDNGIGFDEKYLDRIFQVFQRLHGRNEYEGTGVGLAICRKIVERHGGEITATSIPGQGATFIVTLPVRQFEGETQ